MKCPTCERDVAPTADPRFLPFCSERCQWVDLSKWLSEDYRVPATPDPDDPAPASRESDGSEEPSDRE